MFNPIYWIIPKKFLKRYLRLLFRLLNDRCHYFITVLHHSLLGVTSPFLMLLVNRCLLDNA